jgi:hypothetical protein
MILSFNYILLSLFNIFYLYSRSDGHHSGGSGGHHSSGGSGGHHSSLGGGGGGAATRTASGKGGSGGSDRRSIAGSVGSAGSEGGIIKQLGLYVRVKSDSGKKLSDQEILQQIKVSFGESCLSVPVPLPGITYTGTYFCPCWYFQVVFRRLASGTVFIVGQNIFILKMLFLFHCGEVFLLKEIACKHRRSVQYMLRLFSAVVHCTLCTVFGFVVLTLHFSLRPALLCIQVYRVSIA